jgi:putative peptidoglycan lipid II flippase
VTQVGKSEARGLSTGISIAVSLFTLTGGALELVKNSSIAYKYGSGTATDSFFVAYLVPGTYAMFWTASCLWGLVPLFGHWRNGASSSRERVSDVMLVSFILTGGIAVFLYLARGPLLAHLAPGLPAGSRAYATRIFTALLPLFPIVGVSGAASATLYMEGAAVLPAANKVLMNVVVLAGLGLFVKSADLIWLAVLTVIGTALHAGLLIVEIARQNLAAFRWPRITATHTREIAVALFMPFLALVIRQSSMLGERLLASYLTAGSISVMAYSYQVLLGFSSVILTGVTTLLTPLFSKSNSEIHNSALVWEGCQRLMTVLLPAACAIYVLSDLLVVALFEHGAFPAGQRAAAASVVRGYSMAVLFSALAAHLQSPLWAKRHYSRLVGHNAAMAAVNLVLDFALVPFFGAAGLAWGFTISSAVSCVRAHIMLKRSRTNSSSGTLRRALIGAIGAAAAMLAAMAAARRLLWGSAAPVPDLGFSAAVTEMVVVACVGFGMFWLVQRLVAPRTSLADVEALW